MNQEPRLFCFWTGDEVMSNDRSKALPTLSNTELKVIFLNKNNLFQWLLADVPLHPSYNYLSSVHKADYLRCYFMHNYGGGYSDIKVIEDSWLKSYYDLIDSDYLANGYREINCLETARGRGPISDIWLALNFYKIIGCGAFIFKPNTPFTKEWFSSVNRILDEKYDLLKKYPAKSPRDFYGKKLDNARKSKYPLEWSEICGQVFHPLCLKYYKRMLKTLPTPDFRLPYL